jgi:hypothetical protein
VDLSWDEVVSTIKGVRHVGVYRVDKGRTPFVHVRYGDSERSAHLGHSTSIVIARILLSELVREEEVRK